MTTWNPSNWEEALGATAEDYYTPEQQFAQFRTGVGPQWQYQAPLRNLQQRLQQRYMLGFPGTPGQAGTGFGSFRDYLRGYNPVGGGDLVAGPPDPVTGYTTYSGETSPPTFFGNYAQNPAMLRERAQRAADIANMTTQQLAEDYAPGSDAFNQAAWYRMMYGGEDTTNQRELANLLALQRPGGGEYTGRMANAIQNMMNQLYLARQAQGDPGSGFLQWYLDRTKS